MIKYTKNVKKSMESVSNIGIYGRGNIINRIYKLKESKI